MLQKSGQAEFSKELKFIMDTSILWNSLLKRLSRFLKIRPAVEKTLKDSDYSSKCLDKNELSLTKDLKELSKLFRATALSFSLVVMSYY